MKKKMFSNQRMKMMNWRNWPEREPNERRKHFPFAIIHPVEFNVRIIYRYSYGCLCLLVSLWRYWTRLVTEITIVDIRDSCLVYYMCNCNDSICFYSFCRRKIDAKTFSRCCCLFIRWTEYNERVKDSLSNITTVRAFILFQQNRISRWEVQLRKNNYITANSTWNSLIDRSVDWLVGWSVSRSVGSAHGGKHNDIGPLTFSRL